MSSRGRNPGASSSRRAGAEPVGHERLLSELQDLPSDLAPRTLMFSMEGDELRSEVPRQREVLVSPGEHAPAPAMMSPRPIDAREVDISGASDPRLVLLNDPDSLHAACFRVLRHRLAQKDDLRTIVVSSAERGAGKTTCAINLALAFAEGGRARVLLVEANLRWPSIAVTLRARPPLCFATQLATLRDHPSQTFVMAKVLRGWLHILAVDPASVPRPRLIDGVAFEHAMSELRNMGYDYIIIDTPPVLGSADVNLVQDSADGVVLTAWHRTSRGSALRRAVDQLSPGKIVGVVLLGTKRTGRG